MGWADGHIARLQRGETVQFRPRGNSAEVIGSWDMPDAVGQNVFAAEVLATKPGSGRS